MKRSLKWSCDDNQTKIILERTTDIDLGLSEDDLLHIEDNLRQGFRWKVDFIRLINEIRRLKSL